MAQLTDDCFAFSGPLLPVDEVERIIRERVAPVAEIETVALSAANGRVIARDVVAPIDLPPFDNSAVDGYAVRHADLDAKAETRLAVVERVTAGHAAARSLAAGAAVRIFTGAPMPAGADTVFMQEDVHAERDSVIVPPGLKSGANRRLAGEDVRAGSVVLPAGRRLLAQDVALAAAVGLTALDDGEPRIGGGVEIGVPYRIAVDRRIVERRQVDRRHHVTCDHAPIGGGERYHLDLGHRRYALADDAFDLLHRQQRTRKGEAVVRELRHQPRSACAGTAWMGVACRIRNSAMRSMS